jgi:LysM repeat protein
MLNRLLFILQLLLITGLFSCKVSKPVVSSYASRIDDADYINAYREIAISEMKRTGIPASITLAQGIIESDLGRSTLARDANNHFGIKCHDDWTGPTVRHHDDKRNECFRKYKKAEDSFYDHSDFIKSGSRYNFLFDLKPTDYKAWAKGLKKAGYATNPDYANMLIREIEQNELYNYDLGYRPSGITSQKKQEEKEAVSAQEPDINARLAPRLAGNTVVARVPRIQENNRIQYIIVKDGDTRETLEKEFQMLRWEFPKYNELDNDFKLTPGQILYLQPKRDKAEPGKENYITEEGDTMYLISQRYGIKLKKLYEMNRMDEGEEPEAGRKLWLRNIKPVN